MFLKIEVPKQKLVCELRVFSKHSMRAWMLRGAILFLCVSLLFYGSSSVTFTVTNDCPYTVWPGTLSGSSSPPLPTTGFRLDSGQSIKIPAVRGWSGRIWARTGCNFDQSGAGKCQTGDCGGRLECNGSGATPPASLFEITLNGADDKDFYDVSLVDGYNLPIVAMPRGATGSCNATGCVTDINLGCPTELQVTGLEGGEKGGVVACKSACEAFGKDQYCCSGEFANPTTCSPSFYSTIFKRACPRAYSYAFDDDTSTFTCKASEYAIIFCPNINTKRPNGESVPAPTQGATTTDMGRDDTTSSSDRLWSLRISIFLILSFMVSLQHICHEAFS